MNFKFTILLYLISTAFNSKTAGEQPGDQIPAGPASGNAVVLEDQVDQQVAVEQEQLIQQWLTAATSGDLVAIQNLITKVDINTADDDGCTALLFAAGEGHENIVKFLLQVPGIDVNAHDKDGWSVLIFAIFNNRENIVKLLLQSPSININAQAKDGWTALMFATVKGLENIVNILLQCTGINVNIQSDNGNTPLIAASSWSQKNIAKMLLQMPGINIDAHNAEGDTALTVGEEKESEVVKLIQDKIDELALKAFDAITHNNIEILSSAAKAPEDASRNLEKLRAIISQIGVRVTDKHGDTLLHKAIKYKRLDIVCLILLTDLTLLEINNKEGKDAIELSVGYPEIFKFLIAMAPEKSCTNGASESNSCIVCSKPDCAKTCGGCKMVYYCSLICQRKHWRIHRKSCKPA